MTDKEGKDETCKKAWESIYEDVVHQSRRESKEFADVFNSQELKEEFKQEKNKQNEKKIY